MVKAYVAYHWTWAEYIPECPDTNPFDRSVTADVLLRQEPAEEEDEEEGDGNDDDDGDDDGYSE